MANRFWVAGTTTGDVDWSNSAHWSATSGGPTGASVPTASDDVFFDDYSSLSPARQTIVFDGLDGACRNFDASGLTATLYVTVVSSNSLSIWGDVVLSGSVWCNSEYAGSGFMLKGTGEKTIAFNSAALVNSFVVGFGMDGAGGHWTFASDATSGNPALYFRSGTVDFNDYDVTANDFITQPGRPCAINFGSGTVEADFQLYNSLAIIDAENATLVAYGLNGVNVSCHTLIAEGDVFSRVTCVNALFGEFGYGGQVIRVAAELTVTGLLSFSDTGIAGERISVSSNIPGQAVSIVAADVAAGGIDFYDIAAGGTASWDFSSSDAGDGGGNSGITFAPRRALYWVGSNVVPSEPIRWADPLTWATSSGGMGGAAPPRCHDDVIFDGNSVMPEGEQVEIVHTSTGCRNLSFADLATAMTLVHNGFRIGGTLVSSPLLELETPQIEIVNSSPCDFEWSLPIDVIKVSGTALLTLQVDLVVDYDVSINSGVFDANGFNVTANYVNIGGEEEGRAVEVRFGAGAWTGMYFSFFTTDNTVLVAGTGAVVLDNAESSEDNVAGIYIEGPKKLPAITLVSTVLLPIYVQTYMTAYCKGIKASGPEILNLQFMGHLVCDTFDIDGSTDTPATLQGMDDENGTSIFESGNLAYPMLGTYLYVDGIEARPENTWFADESSYGGDVTGWTFGPVPPDWGAGNAVANDDLFSGNNF